MSMSRAASARYDGTGRLGQIRMPALILRGRRDSSCRWIWPNGCARHPVCVASSSAPAHVHLAEHQQLVDRQAAALQTDHATGRTQPTKPHTGTSGMCGLSAVPGQLAVAARYAQLNSPNTHSPRRLPTTVRTDQAIERSVGRPTAVRRVVPFRARAQLALHVRRQTAR
jgi:hypothetical protein